MEWIIVESRITTVLHQLQPDNNASKLYDSIESLYSRWHVAQRVVILSFEAWVYSITLLHAWYIFVPVTNTQFTTLSYLSVTLLNHLSFTQSSVLFHSRQLKLHLICTVLSNYDFFKLSCFLNFILWRSCFYTWSSITTVTTCNILDCGTSTFLWLN